MENIKSMFILAMIVASMPTVSIAEETIETGAINNNLTKTITSADAVMIPSSGEILAYNSSIKGNWNELKEIAVMGYTISPVDVNIEGNYAHASGLWVAAWLSENISNIPHLN